MDANRYDLSGDVAALAALLREALRKQDWERVRYCVTVLEGGAEAHVGALAALFKDYKLKKQIAAHSVENDLKACVDTARALAQDKGMSVSEVIDAGLLAEVICLDSPYEWVWEYFGGLGRSDYLDEQEYKEIWDAIHGEVLERAQRAEDYNSAPVVRDQWADLVRMHAGLEEATAAAAKIAAGSCANHRLAITRYPGENCLECETCNVVLDTLADDED